MKSKTRKMVFTLAVVGLAALAVAFAVYAAFSATTSNPGNSFAAGSVTLTGNNTASAFYNVSGAKPGDSSTAKCMRVTYSGSLPSAVKVYRSAFSGGSTPNLASYVTVNVTKGTGSQEDCSDFSGSTSVYSGTLSSFGTDWSTGLALTNGSNAAAWSQNDAVTYKFSAQVADDNNAKGLSTGTHSFTWEARNN